MPLLHTIRFRVIIKWTGVGVLCLWLSSFIVGVWFGNGLNYEIRLGTGTLYAQWGPIPKSQNGSFIKWEDYSKGIVVQICDSLDDFEFFLWPRGKSVAGVNYFIFPLWILFAPIFIGSGIIWWQDRRFSTGSCSSCGYNLVSNTSGICPECGTPIPEESKNKTIISRTKQ